MKKLIKMLGISIGCSCSAIASNCPEKQLKDDNAVTVPVPDEHLPLAVAGDLSALQDLSKLYAI